MALSTILRVEKLSMTREASRMTAITHLTRKEAINQCANTSVKRCSEVRREWVGTDPAKGPQKTQRLVECI